MPERLKIHIIGAGISGLTLAIALRQAGFEPVLFEQAPHLGDVGAGITIGPNASRVLTHLGLENRLSAHCWQPRHTGILNGKTAERMQYAHRGEHYTDEFGAPFWHIHRADLLECLADELGPGGADQIHFSHKLRGLVQDEQAVYSTFENGATAECDILIACDGLKSPARELLFETSPAQFTGYVAWRGLIDRQRLPGLTIDPDFALYVGPGRMVGRYAIRNRGLINVVVIARQSGWQEEGWTIPANVQHLMQEFNGWHDSVMDLLAEIPAESCNKWALHTREPMDTWVKGRVALLGDAAHPMTPFFGLGAAMGIEDAMVLARCFHDFRSWPEVLARYQSARVPRGNHVQAESARQGLFLLDFKPGGPGDRSLLGEDPLGLYGYDAVNIGL